MQERHSVQGHLLLQGRDGAGQRGDVDLHLVHQPPHRPALLLFLLLQLLQAHPLHPVQEVTQLLELLVYPPLHKLGLHLEGGERSAC